MTFVPDFDEDANICGSNPKVSTMAKKKTPLTPSELKRRARKLMRIIDSRPTKADAAVKRLRAFHQLGKLIDRAFPGRGGYRDLRAFSLAKALGRNSTSLLYKARAFAWRYDKSELDWLCKQRDGRNMPLTWSHVVVLTSIDVKVYRKALVRQACQENLNHRELAAEVQKSEGRRRSGGRPFSGSDSPKTAVRQLEAAAKRMEKMIEQVWLGDGDVMIDQLDLLSKGELKQLVGDRRRGAVATLKKTEQAAKTLRLRLQKLAR